MEGGTPIHFLITRSRKELGTQEHSEKVWGGRTSYDEKPDSELERPGFESG